jgi:DNA-binding FadR family transcriptional regulator
MHHVRQYYNLLGEISGNEVLAILIEATSSITLDFVISHGIEFTDELIVLRRKVLRCLRLRDADGAARAIAENLAFLHGFVIARAAAH